MDEKSLYGVRNGISSRPGLGGPLYLEGDDPFVDSMVEWTEAQNAKDFGTTPKVDIDL